MRLFCDSEKNLSLLDLFMTDGIYSFGGSGFNKAAMIALAIGVVSALIGLFVPALAFLYTMAWFTGFLFSFAVYYVLMRKGEGRD